MLGLVGECQLRKVDSLDAFGVLNSLQAASEFSVTINMHALKCFAATASVASQART